MTAPPIPDATGGDAATSSGDATPGRRPRPWWKRLALVAAGLFLGLVLAEAGLRLGGFEYRLAPEVIDFGAPSRAEIQAEFDADEDLIWVPRGYEQDLEAHRVARPQLVFMGDSCTYLGHWTRYVPEMLLRSTGRRSMSYANVGVMGWSSYQGRRQLERDIVPLAPRVVTIYYGWNDHWVGFGIEDEQVGSVAAFSRFGLANLRVAQLAARFWIAADPQFGTRPNRVPVEQFRSNLTRIVRTARAHGIDPVLITAPSAHTRGDTPGKLLDRFLRSADELVPLHQQYVEVVREVAASERAPLCDLERDLPAAPHRRALFQSDGIHPTRAGDRAIAKLVMETFQEHGLVERLFE